MKNVIVTTINECGTKMLLIAIAGVAIALTGACNSASTADYEKDTEAVYVADDTSLNAAYWEGYNDHKLEIPAPVECGQDTDMQSVAVGLYSRMNDFKDQLEECDRDWFELDRELTGCEAELCEHTTELETWRGIAETLCAEFEHVICEQMGL